MHFEALSTKYVNFNHFGWFFENFVTKFLFFWQFFLSFLVWEIILLSKNLSILGILHLSYTQREIKKIIFQTSSTCKFASWTWQGKLKQSKFSANRLELARNTTCPLYINCLLNFLLFKIRNSHFHEILVKSWAIYWQHLLMKNQRCSRGMFGENHAVNNQEVQIGCGR